MTKLPAFQFYPGDWMKDPALRSCSVAARGLWMDVLCMMFESDRRGYLQASNGKSYSPEQIARMTGCSTDEASRLLKELETSGVYSRTAHGIIFSRRLVRDEEQRADQRARQDKYRKSLKSKENGDADVTLDVTHLSQPSSSSSSSSKQKQAQAAPAGFALPEWVPRAEWDAWLEVRKRKRAANTRHALELAVKSLDKLRAQGESPAAVLDQLTLKSYTGLFPVADSSNLFGKTTFHQPKPHILSKPGASQ